jgi:predicted nuclease of predicted toxin-antitoxin system
MMKVLLDMPVSTKLLDVLETYEHQGVHAHQIGKACASDSELLEIARSENRIIITADLDFPRLLALSLANGPAIILFRGGNYSDREMCELLERVLEKVPPKNLKNAICVVDKKRIRLTQLPLNPNKRD